MALLLAGFLLLHPSSLLADERDQEIERLRQIVAALEARVEALEKASESERAAPTPSLAAPDAAPSEPSFASPSPEPPLLSSPWFADIPQSGAERLEEARTAERAREAAESPIAFKGALRYTFHVDGDNKDVKRGQSGLDLFRVGAEGQIGNFLLSAEYRFYPFMNTIHHGWIGYDFQEAGQVQLGVTQVPFGILPFASHNFWFGVPYYLGLADDHDLGLKYFRSSGPWDIHLAFFKNEELGDATSLDRYSFDLVRVGPDQANEQINQLNARLARVIGRETDSVHEIGVSAQASQIYNALTDKNGSHWALAAHLDSRHQRWNFQLQLARYEYRPKNPPGAGDDTVRLGAFATSYDISSKGTLGVANVAYNLPVTMPLVDQVLVYNDFSILWKDKSGFDESILNTTGTAIGMGPIFIYLDLIQARNMVFFGDGSLAGDGDNAWRVRFNVNLGYYW